MATGGTGTPSPVLRRDSDVVNRGNEKRRPVATAFEVPRWDRTRALPIQSRAERVCLEDTMSVSGCPPSIGARRLGGQCPDRSGETLVKCLQGVLLNSP